MGIRIALAGNPNCGKTTLFNELTKASQYVGNWPGVTVEKKEGTYSKDKEVTITDLPGIYSLSPYSPEEIVSRDYLIDERPDVVINLVDATNLERNLYLTSQIVELGLPVVIGLNMMDLVDKNGDEIDVARLSEAWGCPVVGLSALRTHGVDELIATACNLAGAHEAAHPKLHFEHKVEEVIKHIEHAAKDLFPAQLARWYAIKLLENEERSIAALQPSVSLLKEVAQKREALEAHYDDDIESIITAQRYDMLETVVTQTFTKKVFGESLTQKIDRIVTNRWLGLPILFW